MCPVPKGSSIACCRAWEFPHSRVFATVRNLIHKRASTDETVIGNRPAVACFMRQMHWPSNAFCILRTQSGCYHLHSCIMDDLRYGRTTAAVLGAMSIFAVIPSCGKVEWPHLIGYTVRKYAHVETFSIRRDTTSTGTNRSCSTDPPRGRASVGVGPASRFLTALCSLQPFTPQRISAQGLSECMAAEPTLSKMLRPCVLPGPLDAACTVRWIMSCRSPNMATRRARLVFMALGN
jgi:hypothetical protein